MILNSLVDLCLPFVIPVSAAIATDFYFRTTDGRNLYYGLRFA